MAGRRALIEELNDRNRMIMTALERRYVPPAWAFFPQVRSATGFAREPRTADAIAMGTWPSRGLELLGFEVKVNRGDWLRELRDPAKADEIYQFCDRWYLVIGDESIVQKGELPPTWGLIVLHGESQLRVHTEAPKLEPGAVDKLFLAAILRRAAEVITPKARLEAEHRRGYKEGVKAGKGDESYELKGARSQLEHLQKQVRLFEKSSGVQLEHDWRAGEIGAAVRQIMAGPGWHRHIADMRRLAGKLIEDIDELEKPGNAEATA